MIVSVLVGGTVGAVSLVGVVNSQTGASDESPAQVGDQFLQYGQ